MCEKDEFRIYVTHCARAAQAFHLKILGARRVTQSKFQTEDPQKMRLLSCHSDLAPEIYILLHYTLLL